ncbi:MAG: hypothetical protein PHD82_14180 [Candidatus Riflebacteria bacterium]|nr:hypothetical protein [Candidatus Riflebacteria bacterium]
MKLRLISLITVFCLAIALLGCGGGGGGSNPAAAPLDSGFDTTLVANYPTVATSYTTMKTSLEEDPAGLKTPAERVALFMPFIAADFQNAAGTLASSALETITLDRLTRYTINSYKFVPTAHKVIDADTIEVTTYMAIDASRKPGAAGGFENVSTVLSPSPVVTWKKINNVWQIVKGLPYLSSEISF